MEWVKELIEAIAFGFERLNFAFGTRLGEWIFRTIVITLVCGGVSIQAHNMGLKNSAHSWAQLLTLMLSVFCAYTFRFDWTAPDGTHLDQPIEKSIELIFWEGIIFWLVATVLLAAFEKWIKPRISPWLDKKFPWLNKKNKKRS